MQKNYDCMHVFRGKNRLLKYPDLFLPKDEGKKGENRPLRSTLKMSTSGKICRRQKLAAYVSLVWPSRSLAKEYFRANRSEHLCCALQPSFLSHSTTRPLKCFMELTRRHHHSAIPQPHLVSPIQRNRTKQDLAALATPPRQTATYATLNTL